MASIERVEKRAIGTSEVFFLYCRATRLVISLKFQKTNIEQYFMRQNRLKICKHQGIYLSPHRWDRAREELSMAMHACPIGQAWAAAPYRATSGQSICMVIPVSINGGCQDLRCGEDSGSWGGMLTYIKNLRQEIT